MNHNLVRHLTLGMGVLLLVISMLACNLGSITGTQAPAGGGGGGGGGGVTAPTDTVAVIEAAATETLTPEIPTDTPQPPTETSTTTPIVHTLIPGEPPAGMLSEITDRNSSSLAAERRANGGDNYSGNLYERPFNANTMDTYYPDLDIIRTRLLGLDPWIYVNITLVGQSSSGGFPRVYGVEVDTDIDGRGDVLVMASQPGTSWATEGVKAWKDGNGDVGAAHPVNSDAPVNGDGYESLVFDGGVGADSDLAWARLSPSDPTSVQIAFKKILLNDDGKYTWDAWAMDQSMLNPAWFDFNDHFTAEEAGSPLVEASAYYPIKALAQVDNTCRWSVGFTPNGTEPGICPVPPTPTPILPGRITGGTYYTGVNTGETIGPGSTPIAGLTVEAHTGSCSGAVAGTAVTNGSGQYSITVQPGTYCVKVNPKPAYRGGSDVSGVVVGNGATVPNINFGFWQYLGMQ